MPYFDSSLQKLFGRQRYPKPEDLNLRMRLRIKHLALHTYIRHPFLGLHFPPRREMPR